MRSLGVRGLSLMDQVTVGWGTPDTGHSMITVRFCTTLGVYTTFDSSMEGGTEREQQGSHQVDLNPFLFIIESNRIYIMTIHFIKSQTERGQFIRNYKTVKLFQLSFFPFFL